jgi:hypothetical protein
MIATAFSRTFLFTSISSTPYNPAVFNFPQQHPRIETFATPHHPSVMNGSRYRDGNSKKVLRWIVPLKKQAKR